MSVLLTDHEWIDRSAEVKAADRYWYYENFTEALKEAMKGKEKHSNETKEI